jgi:seryl-tRNA synthetase
MFDIKWIRDNPDVFDAGMLRRGLAPQSADVLALDSERRGVQTALQDLLAQRNAASRAIGEAKATGEDTSALMADVAAHKDSIRVAEEHERDVTGRIETLLAGLPNIPAADTPDGGDESANIEVRQWGSVPDFDFPAKEHFDIGEALGLMDFGKAAKISGSRFVVLTGALARLSRALGAFMLDLATSDGGYEEVVPPILARDAAVFGTGNLPKFGDDLFRTEDGLWLIPTAEVPLTNLVRERIMDAADLPLRYTALTPCFRSEAGAAGKDTRGMFRQHQFDKVEIVSIVAPEEAEAEHERLTACAEEVLRRLGIHYRVVALCTGDLSFASRKTYDLEVWLPGQGRYREISSCSNFGDFQARRMRARFRPAGEKGTRFVHTLNGSAGAVGRTLIAVLENYQKSDGSVVVPEALGPYMGGVTRIGGDA